MLPAINLIPHAYHYILLFITVAALLISVKLDEPPFNLHSKIIDISVPLIFLTALIIWATVIHKNGTKGCAIGFCAIILAAIDTAVLRTLYNAINGDYLAGAIVLSAITLGANWLAVDKLLILRPKAQK